jgi:hypothetical protein
MAAGVGFNPTAPVGDADSDGGPGPVVAGRQGHDGGGVSIAVGVLHAVGQGFVGGQDDVADPFGPKIDDVVQLTAELHAEAGDGGCVSAPCVGAGQYTGGGTNHWIELPGFRRGYAQSSVTHTRVGVLQS